MNNPFFPAGQENIDDLREEQEVNITDLEEIEFDEINYLICLI